MPMRIDQTQSALILTCHDDKGGLLMRQSLSYMPPPYRMSNPCERAENGYSFDIKDYDLSQRERFTQWAVGRIAVLAGRG